MYFFYNDFNNNKLLINNVLQNTTLQNKLSCIKDIYKCEDYKKQFINNYYTSYGIPRSFFGYLALILNIIGFSPILYSVYKTKLTTNFNYFSIFISFIISGLWLFHGLYETSYSTIIRSIVYIIMFIYILFVKITYG